MTRIRMNGVERDNFIGCVQYPQREVDWIGFCTRFASMNV
jgi:hypothetical protein